MRIEQLWLELKYPEKWGAEAQAAARAIVENILAERGMPPLSDVEGWKRQEAKARNFWAKEIEKQFDTAILEHFGLDVGSLLDLRREAKHQSKAGSGKASLTQQYMKMAVKSFLKAEAQELNFTETWQLAEKEIRKEFGRAPHQTTLKKWLREIAGRPWSTIPPSPGKGRPKPNNHK